MFEIVKREHIRCAEEISAASDGVRPFRAGYVRQACLFGLCPKRQVFLIVCFGAGGPVGPACFESGH
jgi:hypothetical protein